MGRYLNALGYSPEEEERMHRQACQVYDNAVLHSTQSNTAPQSYQTPMSSSNINTTPYGSANNTPYMSTYQYNGTDNQSTNRIAQSEVQQRVKDYEQKYNNTNPFWNGMKSMSLKDWAGVAGNMLQGAERRADAATLGLYSAAVDKMGLKYTERKNKYLREAEQAGIGNIAAFNEGLLSICNSNKGLGKVLSKITPSKGIKQPVKIFMDDVTGSGITNVNQSGSLDDANDKFIDGTMQSPYVRLMQYFLDKY
mgnify:CR=1 FL=1|nr:MAG TPA: hypothetical protein [Caudoviricetes sp.]